MRETGHGRGENLTRKRDIYINELRNREIRRALKKGDRQQRPRPDCPPSQRNTQKVFLAQIRPQNRRK